MFARRFRENAHPHRDLFGVRGRRSVGCPSGAEGIRACCSQWIRRILPGGRRLLVFGLCGRDFRQLDLLVASLEAWNGESLAPENQSLSRKP